MKCVKWIFVVLLTSSLTSFVEKDKNFSGLNVGDVAPEIDVKNVLSNQTTVANIENDSFALSNLKGKYVVLSFWASYDAESRMQNIQLSNMLKANPSYNIEMVSISFDDYESIYKETVRKDQIVASNVFVDLEGTNSNTYKTYQLDQGFKSYLLDENGVIVAKNISIADLPLLTTALSRN